MVFLLVQVGGEGRLRRKTILLAKTYSFHQVSTPIIREVYFGSGNDGESSILNHLSLLSGGYWRITVGGTFDSISSTWVCEGGAKLVVEQGVCTDHFHAQICRSFFM